MENAQVIRWVPNDDSDSAHAITLGILCLILDLAYNLVGGSLFNIETVPTVSLSTSSINVSPELPLQAIDY